MYYALIGDMVGSKKLSAESRRAVQEKLFFELGRINGDRTGPSGEKTPAKGLASKFVITLGDEFQGLLASEGDPIAEAIRLSHALRPYEFRFSVGCGEIFTSINSEAALGADGPAFHNARRIIGRMKPERGARIRVGLEDKELEETLNTVLALCDGIACAWTDKQEKLVFAMLCAEFDGKRLTQSEAADAFGIAQSTVNLQLRRARWAEYARGIRLVREKLSDHMEKRQ